MKYYLEGDPTEIMYPTAQAVKAIGLKPGIIDRYEFRNAAYRLLNTGNFGFENLAMIEMFDRAVLLGCNIVCQA